MPPVFSPTLTLPSCVDPQFDDNQRNSLVNPTLICQNTFEINTNYDRVQNLHSIQKFPHSEYVLVAQDKCHVEHFMKQLMGYGYWSETDRLEDVLTLSSIECILILSDIYKKVQFPTA